MRKQEEQFGGAFPSEEEFQRIYSDCTEEQPQASKAVMDGYMGMRDVFEEYLNAVQEDMFRFAYQCGYEAAMRAARKGDAA